MERDKDSIQYQLDQIDLLRAMYPEITVECQTEILLNDVRAWTDGADCPSPSTPRTIYLSLPLAFSIAEQSRVISINMSMPLVAEPDCRPRLQVRQPDWLTKVEAAGLIAGMPEDDVLSAIEYVREQATELLDQQHKPDVRAVNPPAKQPLHRVFFYFPSISTREKRDDLVRNAPSFRLTGFLLAGKPGVLCLEGGAQDIDNFMNYIKKVSWSDIPSQHKKVSERYRESGDNVTRVFRDMQEITDQIEKRGQRANRSDMKALESWLEERGLDNSFAKVLM
ncbi:hypothetical protein EJ03DRAFT_112623 [Teratosphaeria nubilosa]|uniref:Small nuclear ribonucleoprotein Prp3 C-terminal domain-containing protein n=1 Tax=Teratosphaeria nubilosa TaxID=161662 RepID=A0A6G1L8U0_9PEZI|nr:hypothetical protein EJ03DRAFT_112623 [Teratosphaeria nubilosa]